MEDRSKRRGRRQVRYATLAGLTLLGLIVCVLLAYPFLPALAWAVALAIMAAPLHSRLEKVIPNASVSAGISTAVVVAIIVVPLLAVAEKFGQETVVAVKQVQELSQDGRVESTISNLPYGPQALAWAKENVNIENEGRQAVGVATGGAAAFARGSAWFAVQSLVCVFVLFFLFRDRRHLLSTTKDLSPLSKKETDYLFTRVADSIHATVYVTILISAFQGVTGGLLFWALGLPSPVLWGAVMFVLGVVPLLGAFIVWGPAAVALALGDRWGAAAALVTWGVLMAGPIGNWMYGSLAGERLKLHPVPVLIAFVGGLAVFGVSGMVLGPAALAVTLGLLDVWRRRMNTTKTPAASLPNTHPLPP